MGKIRIEFTNTQEGPESGQLFTWRNADGITDADGIEQTALGGIKNVSFWGFSAQNHQKLVQNMLKFIYLY